ncbi:MAG TPA: tRNA 2-selenouridine(34) synthase MnmH [Bacteroides sp.]|nr:tRNA 2-selenouridine(34) synthase MnmH [Bacteroides sp.]
MADTIPIAQFLARAGNVPVVDVRSPSEFGQGHIPGALNVPLFDDEERTVVGTRYKKINREAATLSALEFAGRKLAPIAREGGRIAGANRELLVHCWRGGMRSKSMAWLFETLGIRCSVLEGGYKAYRRYLRETLATPFRFIVIGGKTGSGKTALLHHLRQKGEQVADLERLAGHKGSAFGSLGEAGQPTTEQFENDLHRDLSRLDRTRVIWIEDESRSIGRCVIPEEIYFQMMGAEVLFLDIPREERARYLVEHYASYDAGLLKSCILKIEKKLGGTRTQEALDAIDRKDFFLAVMISLQYYDKSYLYSLEKNHGKYRVIPSNTVDTAINYELIRSSMKMKHERTKE